MRHQSRDRRARDPVLFIFLLRPCALGASQVVMKTDRIQTDITDITFVFIFLFGFRFEYG
jgi:hypothetical protein